MDPTTWTIVIAAGAILASVGSSFLNLRAEMRTHQHEMRAEMRAQGDDLRKRVDALGDQMGLLRERMAHLDGLLEGLREAIAMQVPKPVAERPASAALPESEPPRRPKRRIDLESEIP